jgi:L-type amino acid transporter 9
MHSGADDNVQYATATFKVIYAYSGWSSVNYVLNNVRDPVRTLKIAGPLGLGICATLYILANIAYFSAATKVRRSPAFSIRVCLLS